MTRLRIGDAERDAAATSLGEHYAAGRLTKNEYDERIDQVWAARFEDDLVPLFADLPGHGRAAVPAATRSPQKPGTSLRRPAPAVGPPGFHPLMLLAPVALTALITAVIVTGSAQWLFLLFFFWFFGGMGRRWHHHRHWTHTQGMR